MLGAECESPTRLEHSKQRRAASVCGSMCPRCAQDMRCRHLTSLNPGGIPRSILMIRSDVLPLGTYLGTHVGIVDAGHHNRFFHRIATERFA